MTGFVSKSSDTWHPRSCLRPRIFAVWPRLHGRLTPSALCACRNIKFLVRIFHITSLLPCWEVTHPVAGVTMERMGTSTSRLRYHRITQCDHSNSQSRSRSYQTRGPGHHPRSAASSTAPACSRPASCQGGAINCRPSGSPRRIDAHGQRERGEAQEVGGVMKRMRPSVVARSVSPAASAPGLQPRRGGGAWWE